MPTRESVCEVAAGAVASPKRRQPLFLKYRSSDIFILLVVCAAVFTDIFLYGVLVPVLPFALTQRVGISEDQVARWNGILLALFNLGLCLGSPIFGFFTDYTSARKLPFLFGLVTLTGATLLLCLSKNIALFAIGRMLQGLSGAICWSVGLSLLADTMKDRIGWASGWVNWAMNAGFLLSPILGGLAYERAGYYSVYYMAFGLLVCDVCLRLAMMEKKDARIWQQDVERGTDVVHIATLGPQSLPNTGSKPVTAPDDAIHTARVPLARGDIPRADIEESDNSVQPRVQNPYWALVKSRRVLATLFCCMMQSASKYAFFAVVPPFVHDTFHWDSLGAGLIFLCVLLPGFFSPIVGILCDRYGTKWLSCSGFVISIPLFVCLRFVRENTLSQKVLFGALLALMGVALALSSTPLMAEIMYVINEKEAREPGIWGPKGVYGTGFGLFTTSFALGGVVGSFMGGYLFQGPGWNTFGWAFAIWCAGGALISWLLVGSPSLRKSSRGD